MSLCPMSMCLSCYIYFLVGSIFVFYCWYISLLQYLYVLYSSDHPAINVTLLYLFHAMSPYPMSTCWSFFSFLLLQCLHVMYPYYVYPIIYLSCSVFTMSYVHVCFSCYNYLLQVDIFLMVMCLSRYNSLQQCLHAMSMPCPEAVSANGPVYGSRSLIVELCF